MQVFWDEDWPRSGGQFGDEINGSIAVPRAVSSVQRMLHNRNKLQPYGENAKNSLYFSMDFAHEQSSSGLGRTFS